MAPEVALLPTHACRSECVHTSSGGPGRDRVYRKEFLLIYTAFRFLLVPGEPQETQDFA